MNIQELMNKKAGLIDSGPKGALAGGLGGGAIGTLIGALIDSSKANKPTLGRNSIRAGLRGLAYGGVAGGSIGASRNPKNIAATEKIKSISDEELYKLFQDKKKEKAVTKARRNPRTIRDII